MKIYTCPKALYAIYCSIFCMASLTIAQNSHKNFSTTSGISTSNPIPSNPESRTATANALYFDGIDAYVEIDASLNLDPEAFTISTWINSDDSNSSFKTILSKKDGSSSSGFDFRLTYDNRIQIFWENGTEQRLTSKTILPHGTWHHVAITYNGSLIRLYIDGVLDNMGNVLPPIPNAHLFLIGAAGAGTPTQHFKGHIDEVRIWKRQLSITQLRFMMNQEIKESNLHVSGKIVPEYITKNDIQMLQWTDLAAYFPVAGNSLTTLEDVSEHGHHGTLQNMTTLGITTAPLPYLSTTDGDWDTNATWRNGSSQYIPGSASLVNANTTIDWNIVKTAHHISMNNSSLPPKNKGNRYVLSLNVSDHTLTITGNTVNQTGNAMTLTHYLTIGKSQPNAKIDLEGESQLIQSIDSDFEPASMGTLERDQQGTADTYTYNYWSSPVGFINSTTNNDAYKVADILFDGTEPVNFLNSGYNGNSGSPIGIADYWIWKFANKPDEDYSAWQHVRRSGQIFAGEGFTMKGPGTGSISTLQNYVFRGKPNNGDINLLLNSGNDYLVGNPYPSAIDANRFILDNGPQLSGGSSDTGDLAPLISGSLYFWEHWAGGNHNLGSYKGGYSIYNLSGATPAAYLQNINPSNSQTEFIIGTKLPGRFIPVSQGFYVIGNTTGTIKFNNGQRVFKTESSGSSTFLRNATSTSETTDAIDMRMKFRIGFNSVNSIRIY